MADDDDDVLFELSPTQRVALESYRQKGSQALVKAAEIIYAVPDPKHHKTLSLGAWKLLHMMLAAAQADGFSRRQYVIPRKEARRNHRGDERIDAALEELRSTPLRMEVTSPQGRRAVMTVNILSSTIEEIEDQDDDLLYFAFTPEFAEIPRRSELWARLSTQTIIKFSSTYSFRLYEIGAQLAGKRDPALRVTVERLRELLHVARDAYPDFGQLRRRTLDPAIKEVNQLAHFDVLIPADEVQRQGRKVTGLTLVFKPKEGVAAAEAARERERHSAGRNARRSGTVEYIAAVPPSPDGLWQAVLSRVDRPTLRTLAATGVEDDRLVLTGSKFACDYARNTAEADIRAALVALGAPVRDFEARAK